MTYFIAARIIMPILRSDQYRLIVCVYHYQAVYVSDDSHGI